MAALDQVHTLKDLEGSLPRPLVKEVFDKVFETSVIQRVAGTTPMTMNGVDFVTPTGNAVAGVVGEGQPKPVIKVGNATKTVKPIKLAAIIVRSTEQRLANPTAMLDDFQDELARAIQRSLDLAVIYGVNAVNNQRIAGVEALNDTTNRVTLGTTETAQGGVYGDIISGYNLVTGAGHDFSGFIADNRARGLFLGAVDANGRPIFDSNFDLSKNTGGLLGLPAAFSKNVAGGAGAVPQGNLRAIGGDFEDNLKLGYVENITFSKSTEASIVIDGETVNLWQNNLEAYRAEAIVGWVLKDTDAFVAYETEAAEEAAA